MAIINCPNCDALLSKNSVVCYRCGSSEGVLENYNIPGKENEQKASETKSILNGLNAKYLAGTIILISIFAISIFFILRNGKINNVKNGTLENFFYGQTIGEALDTWFASSESWDVYEFRGETIVTAAGTAKLSTGEEEWEVFKFKVTDDNDVVFIGAYNSDGMECEAFGSNE